MIKFDIGETVICHIEVNDTDGNPTDPSTSMQIAINQVEPAGKNVLANTDMTKDTTGQYHYDFDSASMGAGKYIAVYTATDGSRVTIEKDIFFLE